MQEYINKQDRIELNFILGAFKSGRSTISAQFLFVLWSIRQIGAQNLTFQTAISQEPLDRF